MQEAEMKVPGGKVVQLSIVGDTVSITGDFFMHPEEKLELLEKCIAAHKNSDTLLEALEDVVSREGIEMIGITCQSLVTLVQQL